MTHKINIALGLFAMTALTLSFSGIASASTYQYVNTSGQMDSVTANSSAEALTASNIATYSGVVLMDNSNTLPVDNQGQYAYVNSSGVVTGVNANTPAQAFAGSNSIAVHSGVILINSAFDQSMIGNSVKVYGN